VLSSADNKFAAVCTSCSKIRKLWIFSTPSIAVYLRNSQNSIYFLGRWSLLLNGFFVYHILSYSFGYILYHFICILIVMFFYYHTMCSFVSLSILIVMYVPFCVFCFMVLFCVLFVCKCVLYYCQRVSTQLQLTNISCILS
jgi:hypothetical protein